MGYLSSAYYNSKMDIKSEGFREGQKKLTNSLYIFDDIKFGTGIDSKSMIVQKVKKDFKTILVNGLAKGERKITNYKRNFPLMTRGRDLKFSYDGEVVKIKWVNGIVFKVVLGEQRKENTIELRHTLHKVVNKEFKVLQSSLQFDNNNNLMLNITLDIQDKQQGKSIGGRVLGVDLGIKYPAYICLSDSTFIRTSLGSAEDFLRVRMQMQERRRRLQKSLKLVQGGKGRKDKLKALQRIKDKERRFSNTYNHMISKNIIEFAVKNQCGTIHMEHLIKEGFSNRILSNWSYYELQNMVEYKANREGLKVKYINPTYTSQKCSGCGWIDKGNRQTQETFTCVNCGLQLNADHNASINIARSLDIVK